MRLLSITLMCLFTTGCISTQSIEKRFGVAEGTELISISETVLYECDPFTTNFEVWFGSQQSKLCIEATKEKHYTDKVVRTLPKGTPVELKRLRHMNGVDTELHLVEVSILVDGLKRTCYIYAWHMAKVFGNEYS